MSVKNAIWFVAVLIACAFGPILSPEPVAAAYPTKPIRLVVPYSPGGNTDVLARLIAQELTEIWKQQVVVDNRPGGNTVIGTGIVARAPADGYTLLFTTLTFSVLPSIQAKLPFNPVRDFAPVSLAVTLPNVLIVNPLTPVKTVREFIQYAKTNAGKLAYASTGAGTSPHLSMELLKTMAGFDITHVPYKGGAPALTAVIAGEVMAVFTGLPIVIPHLKAGRLRALGVTGAKRSEVAPEVPAISETLPGYQVDPWFGLLAPAATPRMLVAALQKETSRALQSADVKAYLQKTGAEPVGSTPEKFAAHIEAEIGKWRDLLQRLGINPQ